MDIGYHKGTSNRQPTHDTIKTSWIQKMQTEEDKIHERNVLVCTITLRCLSRKPYDKVLNEILNVFGNHILLVKHSYINCPHGIHVSIQSNLACMDLKYIFRAKLTFCDLSTDCICINSKNRSFLYHKLRGNTMTSCRWTCRWINITYFETHCRPVTPHEVTKPGHHWLQYGF